MLRVTDNISTLGCLLKRSQDGRLRYCTMSRCHTQFRHQYPYLSRIDPVRNSYTSRRVIYLHRLLDHALMFMRCFASSRCRIISLAYSFIFRSRYVTSTDKCFLSPVQRYFNEALVYSASIVLRKYVRERWSPYFPTFKGSAPTVEVSNLYASALITL